MSERVNTKLLPRRRHSPHLAPGVEVGRAGVAVGGRNAVVAGEVGAEDETVVGGLRVDEEEAGGEEVAAPKEMPGRIIRRKRPAGPRVSKAPTWATSVEPRSRSSDFETIYILL